MKAKLVASGLALAIASGCATTTAEGESAAGDFFSDLVVGLAQIAVEAVFDAAFDSGSSKHDRHEKRKRETRSEQNNWSAPAPAASSPQPVAPKPPRAPKKSDPKPVKS